MPPARPQWSVGTRLVPWVLAVFLAHVLLLEGMARIGPGSTRLDAMAEPEFNQVLHPDTAAPPDKDAAMRAALAAQSAPPPSTVGQAVQARTLFTPPQPPVTAAAAHPPMPARAQPKPPRNAPPKTTHTPVAATPQPPPQTPLTSASPALAPETLSPPPHVEADEVATAWPAPAPVFPPAFPAEPLQKNYEQKETSALSVHELSASLSDNSSTAWLNTWPTSTRLSYTLLGHYRGDLHGHARVQWQRTAERYQAQVHVSVGLFMDMQLTSQGRITPTRLWPETYEEERRGKKRGARLGEQQLVLDNGRTLPRPPHLQDTASQFVQLAQDFASGRQRLHVGAVIPVTLARPGGVDDWVYDVVALDLLDTPLGPLEAYHLKPRPLANPRGTVTAEMWFAPSLKHLPARIRLTLNADTWLDLSLSAVVQSAAGP